MAYAAGTSVDVGSSRAEIERTLRRYKADAFGYMQDGPAVAIQFRLAERWIKFVMTLPDRNDDTFWLYRRGATVFRRVEAEGVNRWEQACRQKWRALALVIKAKLEAVDAGITSIEDEFLAATIMADGSTFGDWAKPQIEEMYRLGQMPKFLALGGPRS